jgi:hypothetical protein
LDPKPDPAKIFLTGSFKNFEQFFSSLVDEEEDGKASPALGWAKHKQSNPDQFRQVGQMSFSLMSFVSINRNACF